VKDGIGPEMEGQFGLRFRLHVNRRDLLHAANLRHGTGGFTSPPKEGIFSPSGRSDRSSLAWKRKKKYFPPTGVQTLSPSISTVLQNVISVLGSS
jgi:hypothetical protein